MFFWKKKSSRKSQERARDGPGCWAFVQLAGQIELSQSTEEELPNWLWTDASGQVGGRVAPEKQHCTLLLRLNSPGSKHAFTNAAKKTRAFSIQPGQLYVSKVKRLSEEFKDEVYSVGLELKSDGISELKSHFFQALKNQGFEDNIDELLDRHDPYHATRTSDGHTSIAYLRQDAVEAVRKKCDDGTFLAASFTEIKVRSVFFTDNGTVTECPLLVDEAVEKEKVAVDADGQAIGQGGSASLEYRGLSFSLLESFLEENKDKIPADATTEFVALNVVVPITAASKLSYAEMQPDGVGPVDFFVSHAWRYKFWDLVDCIRQHHNREGKKVKNVKYWIDIFCANQHNLFAPTEIPSLWKAIEIAKGTMIVLQPWDDPITLQRIWCLYELLGTMKSKILLHVEIPSSEHQRFQECLLKDFESVRQNVGRIDSENAEATNPQDKKQIKLLIRESVGFTALNTIVKDQLRQWLLKAGLNHLADQIGVHTSELYSGFHLGGTYSSEEKQEILLFAHSLSRMVGDIGDLKLAAKLYESVLSERIRLVGKERFVTCSVVSDMSFCLSKMGQAAESEELLKEFIPHLEQCLEEGNMDKGETLEQLEALLLQMRNNLAMAIGAQGADRYDEALSIYESVLQGRNALYGGEENRHSIATLNNMAWLLAKQGKQQEAKTLFERVVKFRKEVHGEKHPAALNAAQNLAETLRRTGNTEEAANMMRSVCTYKVENMGLNNKSTQRAITVLIECLEELGLDEEAQEWKTK